MGDRENNMPSEKEIKSLSFLEGSEDICARARKVRKMVGPSLQRHDGVRGWV